MHFKINEEGRIIDFHIERWDLDALGSDMTKEIETHKNKHWEEFIHFALEKKLFLKIRRLFLLGDKHTIYFWESAPIYGEGGKEGIKLIIGLDQERNVSIQYAKFFLRGPETAEPQLISVLYEAGTVQLLEEAGYKPIDIMIEMSEDKIKDISIAFNITRNNKNSLYILMSKSGDGEELMEGRLSQVMFTGLGEKTSELDILSEDQLKDIIQSGDLQYIRILPTFTNNESKQKEILNLLEQVKKLKKKWWKFW